jgi:hypothetical protein
MANTIPLNSTALEDREYSQDEVDAMAAAELPVQDAPIPPSATTAPAAASGAPEPTGSAGLITGEGALPARGPAMGPVAQLEDREYTAEEIDLFEQANQPKGYTQDEVDKMVMEALEDPTYAPTRDEYFDQKATKARLKAQGKIPGNGELAAKAVGGLFVSAFDAFNSTLFSPVETLAKSPATLQTGIGRAAIGAMQLGGWAKQVLEGQPKYINEATGEYLFADAQDPMTLAGFQERYPNQPIRPTNEEDLKDYEFQNHIKEKGIDAEYQALGQKTAPTELLTRVLTGRNQQEAPIESQAQIVEIATDPTNLIPFGAGAKTLGLSRGMKIVSSKTASGIEKLAGGLVKGNDILAERFARVVTEKTGVSPQNISAAANAMTFGRNVGIGGGIAAGAAAVGAPPEVTATIAGFYPAYKAGLGVLRKIETAAGASKIILREAADATNGLDQAARAAVLANPAVPSIFKEVLERPSQFVSIESTPARLAANQALSPQMRAFMGKLSNPAIVQAVRGSSALATGAVKGAAANVPFALLAANAGQDEDAAAMLAMGGTFGALGGGVDRFTGLQQRRQQAALSDVSRMLVDIELNGGDVGKMMSTQTPDNLVRLAAMQGTFRNGLDFVPLSAEEYAKNVDAQGGAGTAGMFVQAPIGERAKVFINLDARRGGVEPHEFGHALLASGALDGQQKYAARAWVDKTYGPEGVQARAREYASNIIRGKNASAFPDGKFEISRGTLAAEMDNLSQGGLARGDMDGLDWARDEIFAETFAKASNTMDFAAIRRGAPAGGNMLTFAESVLGAQARALSASGVRIDPQTGQALDTPGSLFKENPILATDKALLNQLGTYINNYRQWANDPTHEKPRPNRIAPSGRASDIANNPQVTFYDRGDGVQVTTFATQDPATGQAILRDQRDLNQEHAKVKEQIRNIVGSKLIDPTNPVLGPKKTADGRVTVRGRVLPPTFDFLNGFMPHIRAFARQFEALGAAGESMQVRYHAIGSGDTGAFRVNRLGNLEAITREVIPWGWELTKAGNLNATVLDLSQFRNRAMRGIAERNPALAPFDYDMGKIESDLKTYMENHRQELPGSTKIGEEKRDAINAILGIATTKNRERNALSGSFGLGSAIKQFRLDRVDAAVGTGRTGFHFDYDRANRNFMPDKPAPMPDLSKDLTGQAMPDAAGPTDAPVEQGFKVPEIYKVISGPNGKSRVINAEGKKVTDYPTLEKAMARATEENNLLAPMSDLKKLFTSREDRQAITEAQKRITEVAKNNPEATRLEIQRDETGLPKIDLLEDSDGNPILDEKGNQVRGVVFAKKEYELRKAPGLSKDDNIAVKQGVALLLPEAKRVLGIPAIAAGKGWYGRMRDFLQRSFGANIEVFGQLLGATSARTPVDTNFKQGLEALKLVALGKYDDLLQRFDAHVMDIKSKAESGQLKTEWLAKNPNKRESMFALNDEYRKAINTFKEVPLRQNGAKYNANSQKVLHALYGIWLSQTKGPKTPNFAGNLTGRTLRATIDVWAARNLRRLLYSNKIKKWRILPEQESGVKFTVDKDGNYGGDFEYGQRIYDEVARQLNMNPDDLQAVMWFAEKDVWETNGWTNTVGAEKSSFDKEAGKLNLDRYQIGLTTFTSADKFDPKVQEAERISFRNAVRKVPNLAVSRITESSGLYGGTLEPTFDVEFSVQRDAKIDSQNYLEPTIREALAIADRRGQIDVLTSLVVDIDHPNARPMVEIGFKSPAKPAEIDAVVEAFKANGIDGFTIAKNERGDVLGLRSQYVPEISARYDTLDHLDPAKFVQNALAWTNSSRTALAQIQNIDNVSYRKEGHVSSAIYGKEEYRTVNPVDLRRSNAADQLGRRRSILKPGS